MITYNHEKFICKALDSIIGQETKFDYELIIGEDCSTDKTKKICLDYQKKYPEKIKVLNRIKNLGVFENFVQTLYECKGDFVAFCEGDDYWPDKFKLQKQIDFLLNNPNSAGCFTDSLIINENDEIQKPNFFEEKPKSKLILNEIVPFGSTPANTILFRQEVINNLPNWFKQYPRHSGLNLLIAMKGSYDYLDEVTGAYRVHSGGIWSMKPSSYRSHSDLLFLKSLYNDRFFKKEYGTSIRNCIKRSLLTLIHDGIKVENNVGLTFKYIWSFLVSSPFVLSIFKILFIDVILKRILLKIGK